VCHLGSVLTGVKRGVYSTAGAGTVWDASEREIFVPVRRRGAKVGLHEQNDLSSDQRTSGWGIATRLLKGNGFPFEEPLPLDFRVSPEILC